MMRMISRSRVDQNRIGVRGQIRIGGYIPIRYTPCSICRVGLFITTFNGVTTHTTVQDIKLIYEKSFARKQFSNNDVLLLLKKRHKERDAAKISHHRVNSHLSNV